MYWSKYCEKESKFMTSCTSRNMQLDKKLLSFLFRRQESDVFSFYVIFTASEI